MEKTYTSNDINIYVLKINNVYDSDRKTSLTNIQYNNSYIIIITKLK
jgi:hypothetical protein